MKKQQLEKLFTDRKAVEKMFRTMKAKMPSAGKQVSQPASAIEIVAPRTGKIRPEPEEMGKHFSNYKQDYLLNSIGKAVPEVSGKNPLAALEFFIKRYKKKPSNGDYLFIEDAVNRLLMRGKPDPRSKKAVTEAVKLMSVKTGTKFKGVNADMLYCFLYQHKNFGGQARYFTQWDSGIYKQVPSLGDVSFNDAASSVSVGGSSFEIGGKAVVFQNNRYQGRYVSYDITPGAETDINYIGDFMNDRASSVLLIRKFRNELSPVLAGNYIPIDTIKKLVSKDGSSPRGNPIVTWDMWPDGKDSHPNEPGKAYVYMKVPIEVDPSSEGWYIDYDAEIRFWIYLYVDGAGKLQGYLDYYGVWVEGGVISGKIMNKLMNQVAGSLGQISSLVDEFVALANLAGPFANIYFLPGANNQQGNTDDGISIVLIKPLVRPIKKIPYPIERPKPVWPIF